MPQPTEEEQKAQQLARDENRDVDEDDEVMIDVIIEGDADGIQLAQEKLKKIVTDRVSKIFIYNILIVC